MTEVSVRLEQLYNALIENRVIKNKREFSEALGIDYGSLNKYFSGKVNLSINNLNYHFYKERGINIEWLLTGIGSMFVGDCMTGTMAREREKQVLNELKARFETEITEKLRSASDWEWFWCECHPNIFDEFMGWVIGYGYPAKIVEADVIKGQYRIEVTLKRDSHNPDPTKYGFNQKEFEERQKDLA